MGILGDLLIAKLAEGFDSENRRLCLTAEEKKALTAFFVSCANGVMPTGAPREPARIARRKSFRSTSNWNGSTGVEQKRLPRPFPCCDLSTASRASRAARSRQE